MLDGILPGLYDCSSEAKDSSPRLCRVLIIVGRPLLGMKGDYPQYNPRFGQGFLLSEVLSAS